MPKPEITFYLKADDVTGRKGFGGEIYDKPEIQILIDRKFEKVFNSSEFEFKVIEVRSH